MSAAPNARALLDSLVSEKDFQQHIIDTARLCGWDCYHTHDSRRSEPGFPDLVLAHPRLGLIMPELKTERGRVSAAQQHWLDLLRHLGIDAPVWRPRDLPLIEKRLQGTS